MYWLIGRRTVPCLASQNFIEIAKIPQKYQRGWILTRTLIYKINIKLELMWQAFMLNGNPTPPRPGLLWTLLWTFSSTLRNVICFYCLSLHLPKYLISLRWSGHIVQHGGWLSWTSPFFPPCCFSEHMTGSTPSDNYNKPYHVRIKAWENNILHF